MWQVPVFHLLPGWLLAQRQLVQLPVVPVWQPVQKEQSAAVSLFVPKVQPAVVQVLPVLALPGSVQQASQLPVPASAVASGPAQLRVVQSLRKEPEFAPRHDPQS